jgi:hypothetical protein
MLIWLASYPRSGNTFVRIVLKDAFGLRTSSWTGDSDDRVFSRYPGVVDVVGHRSTQARGDDLIAEANASDQLYVIKTHEPPLTDDPVIYIVRDGRSAIVSYHHYLREIANISVPLEDVIAGRVYAGSWSDHFKAWRPDERRNALLLRYEDISNRPDDLVRALGTFISTEPKGAYTRTFSELNQLFPSFFRYGNDLLNIDEMQAHTEYFMQEHGALMRKLSYC